MIVIGVATASSSEISSNGNDNNEKGLLYRLVADDISIISIDLVDDGLFETAPVATEAANDIILDIFQVYCLTSP